MALSLTALSAVFLALLSMISFIKLGEALLVIFGATSAASVVYAGVHLF